MQKLLYGSDVFLQQALADSIINHQLLGINSSVYCDILVRLWVRF